MKNNARQSLLTRQYEQHDSYPLHKYSSKNSEASATQSGHQCAAGALHITHAGTIGSSYVQCGLLIQTDKVTIGAHNRLGTVVRIQTLLFSGKVLSGFHY